MNPRWGGYNHLGRCPNHETRKVRGDPHRRARNLPRQVRCSRVAKHEGPCEWRGVAFGLYVA